MACGEKVPEYIIVTKILPKLSAKSILRFKSVRKSWYDSIRNPSPQFVDDFLRNSHSRPKGMPLLFSTYATELSRQYLFSAVDDGDEKIKPIGLFGLVTKTQLCVSSVNGIFCIYPEFDQVGVVSIINPTTREVISLPSLGKSRVYYGFGFDPARREYKVVGLCCGSTGRPKCVETLSEGKSHVLAMSNAVLEPGVPIECQIFTLGGPNSWTVVNPVSPVYLQPTRPGICVNGTILWLVKDLSDFPKKPDKGVLVAFDLGREAFAVIPLHSDINNMRTSDPGYEDEHRLTLFGGLLAVIKYEYDVSPHRATEKRTMYVLKDYQNCQWVIESICDSDETKYTPYGSTHNGHVFVAVDYNRLEDNLLQDASRIVYRPDMSQESHWSIPLPWSAVLTFNPSAGRPIIAYRGDDTSVGIHWIIQLPEAANDTSVGIEGLDTEVHLLGSYPENIMPLPRND